ncbi:MAG TPA: LLM class flavin-dependent oxidoreductase [Burkholderiales bacterium]
MTELNFGIFDWVEASNSLSPREIYQHKIELAAAADQAGFHGLFLAEHQGTPLSIDGSPSVLLAALIQRTRRLRLGALTFCLPWYDPYRFYNEVCMLDQLSGGRLELGVGRGVSPIESRIFGLTDIEQSRAKYRETLDLFFAACKNRVLRYRDHDVDLYNKPLQHPWPPLWFPSSNQESIEFTARHGYSTVLNTTIDTARQLFSKYREIWSQHRNDPGRHNAHVERPFLAKTQHIVIAESGAEAEELGLKAYETWKSHMHYLTRKHGRPEVLKLDPFAKESVQRLAVGTPQSILPELEAAVRDSGMNYLMCIFSFGDLAPAHALRSLQLFSREVMPKLQDLH